MLVIINIKLNPKIDQIITYRILRLILTNNKFLRSNVTINTNHKIKSVTLSLRNVCLLTILTNNLVLLSTVKSLFLEYNKFI